MSDASTVDPPRRARRTDDASERVSALVVAWLDGDPELMGAVLFPDDEPLVFGRGAGEPGEARLVPVRQRPGDNTPLPAARAPWMSRRQLRVQRLAEGKLALENVGKCALTVRRQVVAQAVVGPGELVSLGDGALFLVVERPRVLPASASWREPTQRLGDPDPLGMVGESEAMWALRDHLAFVGRQKGHVLVLGPSGTGKERVAQALHRLSSAAARPLIARSAATIPDALMDAELFGHVANYPNPGMRERPGLVGEADGSTLFLDEIGELPESLQAHLLRLLDSGEYQRLGDPRQRRATLRIVAATHRDPSHLKADLAARFRHVVRVPPLGARKDDVPLLMRHILRLAATEDPFIAARFFDEAHEPRVALELVELLMRLPLPLQIRELEAFLWQAIARSAARGSERLEVPTPSTPTLASADREAVAVTPHEVTRDALEEALALHGGRLERVWRALGLKNRYVLRRLMHKHGLGAD